MSENVQSANTIIVPDTSDQASTTKSSETIDKPVCLFGVGCFHFGIKKSPPFKITILEYIHEIEIFLQSISNISNIVIEKNKIKDYTFDVVEDPPPINHEVFPAISPLNIKFEIYIPFRIQEQFATSIALLSMSTKTEKFIVRIQDNIHCPITIVELVDPQINADPSDAVVIVREFLTQQNQKFDSKLITFQCLGPSPFHANFYIRVPQKQDKEFPWFFWSESFNAGSYADIDIYYDKDVLKDVEEAKTYIYKNIGMELSLFYRINQYKEVRIDDWEKVEKHFNDIIEIQRKNGLFSAFRRYFSSKTLSESFISIAEFEKNDVFYKIGLKESITVIYDKDNPSLLLKWYIDNEVSSIVEYPTKQLLDLANLFEHRRENAVELVTLIISAIIGGVIGSVITTLLSTGQHP